MGSHRRHRSIVASDDTFVGNLPHTPDVHQHIKVYDQMRILYPENFPPVDTTKPFLDRTIIDYGGLPSWYSEVMIPFNTYVRPPIKGVVRMCYKYATYLTTFCPDVTYVEGYAVSSKTPIPLFHAWGSRVTDRHVIDPTWRGQKTVGTPAGYCGIPFSRKFKALVAVETGMYGILENLWMMKNTLSTLPMREILDTRWYDVDKLV